MRDEIIRLKTEFEQTRARMIDTMKSAFSVLSSTFFSKYPEIQAILWTQYTPYFNDGDTCEFGVNDFYVIDADAKDEDGKLIKASDFDREYDADDFPSKYMKPPYYNEQRDSFEFRVKQGLESGDRWAIVCAGVEEMLSTMRELPEDVYLQSFGDHVLVIMTKDGVEVKDYEHE